VHDEILKLDAEVGIDAEIFKVFVRRHKAMLFPAFNLQQQLRNNVLGAAFWKKSSNRRVELSKGKYVTMSQLMQMVRWNSVQHSFSFCKIKKHTN
jgi:hypothetical protein